MLEKKINEINDKLAKHFEEDVTNFTMISNTLYEINQKIDLHVENFKEHKLAQEKSNDKISTEYGEVKLSLKNISDNVQPAIDAIDNFKLGKKFFFKLWAGAAAMVGFLLGLFELIKLILNLKK